MLEICMMKICLSDGEGLVADEAGVGDTINVGRI
jgi:hypothetical protein